MKFPNLILIAGTGNKSGKTTFACRVIEQFRDSGIIGIKITPHFHETTPGLRLIVENEGYSLYEETNSETSKDTSRMLRAGASRVYFAKVNDSTLPDAFNELNKLIPQGAPVICESPALRHFIEPGLFIIMKSGQSDNNKDLNKLLAFPHVMLDFENLKKIQKLEITFKEGKWKNL